MNGILLSIVIIVVILNLSIVFGLSLQYDLMHNIGRFQFRLFGLTILSLPFTFVDKYLELTTKKKVVKIKIDFADKRIIFFEKMGSKMQSKMYLDKMYIKIIVCQTDPMIVSMLSGLSVVVLNIWGQMLRCNHQDAEIETKVDAGYRHQYLSVYYDTTMMISLFDIISSILTSCIELWSVGYEERKKS